MARNHSPARLAVAFLSLIAVALACAQSPATRVSAAGPRLIVRFAQSDVEAAFAPKSRIARLARDAGIELEHVRPMALGAQVVRLPLGSDAHAVAAMLKARGDVSIAVPDRRLKRALKPVDTNINSQPYLTNDPTSISAFAAWDLTTGSASTVVAVIDSGILLHPDLAGRILPGYDFITDVKVANDGSGRDPDATDPGDWVTPADLTDPAFTECAAENSSWHGTAVAGVIASNSNNHAFLAGIDWAAKILPVRALGKCGGDFSDIFDAIVWAAGMPVPGVASNPFPAHVINLSLGGPGDGPCQPDEDSLFSQIFSNGITKAIVASAGNDNASADVNFPSSCPSTIAVAATTVLGNRTSYSNYGTSVDIAAPGGEGQQGADFGAIAVLTNIGTTVASTYSVRGYQGTSFSAPMVSGVISLMLGVAPNLTPAQVRDIVRTTAKPFPAASTCSTSACGSGIVNAQGAVLAAIAASGGSAVKVPVIEYYNAGLNHYFVTAKGDEIAALDANLFPGWARTGETFNAYAVAAARTSPVCRFYLPPGNGDSHFYSALPSECAATQASNPVFVLESSAEFFIALPDLVTGACAAGTLPVYRLWNHRPDTNHRFTTSLVVRDQMLFQGFIAEGAGIGVTMCAPL